MRSNKPHHFTTCEFSLKSLILILSLAVLTGCERQGSNQNVQLQSQNSLSENALNINIATVEELEKLPHIGKETAKKIVAFRETYGKFRRAESLILVGGISDKKFRDLRNQIKTE